VQPYAPEYTHQALATFLKQSKRSALKIHAICGRLADHPHRDAELCGPDEAGRQLRFVLIDGVGLRYWVDDAICRVIIVKIVLSRRR
jgi:hypothetical protein